MGRKHFHVMTKLLFCFSTENVTLNIYLQIVGRRQEMILTIPVHLQIAPVLCAHDWRLLRNVKLCNNINLFAEIF